MCGKIFHGYKPGNCSFSLKILLVISSIVKITQDLEFIRDEKDWKKLYIPTEGGIEYCTHSVCLWSVANFYAGGKHTKKG